MKLVLQLAAVSLILTACGTSEPLVPVAEFEGRPVYEIYTSRQVYEELTPIQMQNLRHSLETENEHGSLPYRASQQCPQGYRVIERGEPDTRFIMTYANGIKSWRVSQTFRIACNA